MQSAFVITSVVPVDNFHRSALDQVMRQKLLLCSLARCVWGLLEESPEKPEAR